MRNIVNRDTSSRKKLCYLAAEKFFAQLLSIGSFPASIAILALASYDLLSSRFVGYEERDAEFLATRSAIVLGLLFKAPADMQLVFTHVLAILEPKREQFSLDESTRKKELLKRRYGDGILTGIAALIEAGLSYRACDFLFKNSWAASISTLFCAVGMGFVYQGHGIFSHHYYFPAPTENIDAIDNDDENIGLLAPDHSSPNEKCQTLFTGTMTLFAFINHALQTFYSLQKSNENFFEPQKMEYGLWLGLLFPKIIFSIIFGAKDAWVEKHHAQLAAEQYRGLGDSLRVSFKSWCGRGAALVSSFLHVLPTVSILASVLSPTEITSAEFFMIAAAVVGVDVCSDTVFHGEYIRNAWNNFYDCFFGKTKKETSISPIKELVNYQGL